MYELIHVLTFWNYEKARKMDKKILEEIYAKIGEDFINQMDVEKATSEETGALLEILERYVSPKRYCPYFL